MRRRVLLVSAVAVALAATASPLAVLPGVAHGAAATRCRAAARTDVRYATRPGVPASATSLDVYPAPRACGRAPTPVVVWVHGGGWAVGDKRGVGAKLDLFHDLGAAVVSVNYRLSSLRVTPPGDAPPVQHPDHAEDLAAAVAWVSEHAATFGADPHAIVLVGHSAGAHLVALVGADPSFLGAAGVPTGAVGCVVALDTEGYDLAEKVAVGGPSARLVRNVFGNDPEVWRDASPITHAADDAPVRYLVVTRGTPRRQAEAARFVDAVDAAGGDATLVTAPSEYTHADVNRRLGAPGETVVTPPVHDFVEGCTA